MGSSLQWISMFTEYKFGQLHLHYSITTGPPHTNVFRAKLVCRSNKPLHTAMIGWHGRNCEMIIRRLGLLFVPSRCTQHILVHLWCIQVPCSLIASWSWTIGSCIFKSIYTGWLKSRRWGQHNSYVTVFLIIALLKRSVTNFRLDSIITWFSFRLDGNKVTSV